MSKEEQQELKSKGFIIVQWWHTLMLIALMLVTLGASWGIASNKLSSVEQKVSEHQAKIEMHEKELQVVKMENAQTLIEIKVNLKNLCEEWGVKYQEVVK